MEGARGRWGTNSGMLKSRKDELDEVPSQETGEVARLGLVEIA